MKNIEKWCVRIIKTEKECLKKNQNYDIYGNFWNDSR